MNACYEFIDGEKANYPIVKMCAWLEVSKSGFYEWCDRPQSATAARREALTADIHRIFDACRQTYGYRRVHAELEREGTRCSPELVRAIMRAEGLEACQPRPWRRTTIPDEAAAATDDLLAGDFTADAPGSKLVGDITYIRTWQGFVYLATVIDCYTKAVVGWSIADHMRTDLVTDAMTMAAGNVALAEGAVFHSDRGSQYTSDAFRTHLAGLGVHASVSRTGVCWDNALAESFFGTLKNELVYRTVFATRRQAHAALVEYIEVFYNRQRIHSSLGYRTPLEVYLDYCNAQVAA